MFKALFKKELLQMYSMYLINRKTGKRRSVMGMLGFGALMLYVVVVFVGMFSALAGAMADLLIPAGKDVIYFDVMILFGIMVGVFGGVVSTYAALYQSKDNELLLSMPIPSTMIIAVRMISVYVTGLLYTLLVMGPTVVIYWLRKSSVGLSVDAGMVVSGVLGIFLLALLVHVLTCGLGYLVALISSKLKNKSYMTVIVSLIFFLGYYYVCFQAQNVIAVLLTQAEAIGMGMQVWAKPLTWLAAGCSGQFGSLAMFALLALILFGFVLYLLAKSFRRIATMGNERALNKESGQQLMSKQNSMKAGSVKNALLKKEFRRFTASATYMLNCGLGLFFMPIATIIMIMRLPLLKQQLTMIFGSADPTMVSLLMVGMLCLLMSMCIMTAPSISLEGKNLWILHSLPVDPKDILMAKIKMHCILSVPMAFLCSVGFMITLKPDVLMIIAGVLAPMLFTIVVAYLGLIANLNHPILEWTNETVPVKQSFSTFIGIFGSWGIVLVVGALYLLLAGKMSTSVYVLCVDVFFAALIALMHRWLMTVGRRKFAQL